MNIFKRVKKLLAVVTSMLMLVQPILPVFPSLLHPVYAQEATASSEQPSPTPTEEVTPSPTEEPALTPEPTSGAEASAEATPTPTETVEPTSTPTEQPPQQSTDEPPKETGPPQEQGQILEGVSVTPTPTITVEEPVEQGELQAVILQNIEAESLNLDNVDPSNSATLTTDKADYAPTDTAVITGTGFTSGETYTLTISSDDPPPTSMTAEVTADENGSFVYAYQLDGTYRPNYKVEAKSNSTTIAETSFTDSPAAGCYNDGQGVNDEPGQKDLTKACASYTGLPTNINIDWNWDAISGSGSNTYDACSLYDTDNDGFANNAVCVTLIGSPLAQHSSSPRIYSCNDTRADRCAGDSLVATPYTTSCSVSQQNSDPFASGDAYPQDTVAACTVNVSEVGGANSSLLDVCSFPSDQPNSDPSDCIFASTASQTGKLEIIKNLVPTTDPGKFNLQIDSVTYASDIGNGGTTGEKIVDTGNRTFAETAGTGTSLTNYTTTVSCLNAAGGSVSTTGTNPWTVNVANNADIVCTITNTRNQGTLRVIKTVINDNGGTATASAFSFQVNGDTVTSFEADGQNDLTVAPGTYSVTEPAVAGYATSYDNCASVSVTSGGTTTCTITNNDIGPLLTVTKVVTNDNGGTKVIGDFPLFVDATQVTSGAQNGFNVGTYTISETGQTGYTATISGDCAANGSVTLALGDVKSCTITNNDNAPSLTLNKIVLNNNGGTAAESAWTLTANGGNAGVLTGPGAAGNTDVVSDETFKAATYSLLESTGPGGYGASAWSCVIDNGVAVEGAGIILGLGQIATCTITNNDNSPQLTVIKHVINNNGGLLNAEDFTMNVTATNPSDASFSGVESPGTTITLDAGSYSVAEPAVTGYTTTYSTDCTGTAVLGQTKTCTITNDDIAPILTFTKIVNNLYGGILGASDFPLFINGGLVTTGVPNTLLANFLYTLTETQQTGYTGGYFTGDCNAAGSISLAVGDNKTCTITNYDVQPKLTVTKVVINDNGGTKEISDFPLFVDSLSVKSGAQTGLNAGTYTVSETGDSGYTSTITGDCAPNGSVTLAAGDVKSCTITNDDQQGSIQIVKNTIGGNGTFDFSITGPSSSSPSITTSGNTGNTGLLAVNAGTYSVSETAQTGWDLTFASCDNGTIASFAVANGETTTCTFTNTAGGSISGYKLEDGTNAPLSGWDIQLWEWVTNDFFYSGQTDTTDANGYFSFENVVPGVYQLREVLKNGWTQISAPADVTLTAGENDQNNNFVNFEKVSISGQKFNDQNGNGVKDTGEAGLSGWTIDLDKDANGSVDATTATDGSGTYSFADLTPGTYRIREVGQPGWTQTTADPGDIAILSGQDVTDVDFGNQMRGSVTIIKDAVPNNAQNFTFTSPQLGGFTLDDDSNATLSNTQVFSDLGSNTYEITENAVSGWTLTNLSCDGDNNAQIDLSGRTATVNLDQPGETITCTFTNTKYGSITGRKYDDTNGDGTKNTGEPYLDGWTVYLFDEQMQQLSSVVTGNGSFEQGQYKFTGLLPGTYFTCEDLQSGWTQTDPSSGTQYNGTYCRQRTLTAGQNLTGVHFGNFQNASIIVHKNVVLPDGSSEVSDSTEFTALLNDGDPEAIAEGTDATYSDLAPGTYTVTEDTPPAGYALVSITDIGQITVTSGGTHHIYVINRQLPATLILDKLLPNDDGGDAVPEDFPVYIDGSQSFWGSHEVNAGSFTVSEDTIPGYTPSSWGQDCDGDGNVTLLPGETKTCTIINDDIAPTVTLIKEVINDNGGTADVGDFILSLGNSQVTSGVPNAVLANTPYEVDEAGPLGYSFVSLTGDPECPSVLAGNVEADEGKNITCTITNDDNEPSLTLVKVVDNNGVGTAAAADWTLTATGATGFSGNGPSVSNDPSFDAGTYDLSESGPSDYTASDWECVGGNQADADTVEIGLGDSVTCTITNTRDIGDLVVHKLVDINADGIFDQETENDDEANTLGFTWGFASDNTPFIMGYTEVSLATNTYDVYENDGSVPDYHFVGWFYTDDEGSCTSPDGESLPAEISVTKDTTTDITLCNARDTGLLRVHKVADTNGDGQYDEINPTDFKWGTENAALANTAMGINQTFITGAYNVYENNVPTYQFTGWFPGEPVENRYSCSNLPEGSQYRELPTSIAVTSNNEAELTLCNQLQNPILTISKSHAASDDVKNPSENVLFTITVTATQSAAFNVFVTDLPANGFTYRTNSWTANSSARGDLKALGITTQPTYASPGVWTLGDMEKDETVTLTYIADISTEQKPGIYKDLAWAYGCRFETDCEVGDANAVLSNAVNPGFIDDNFVGTQVEISKDLQSGATLNKTEGEVLGAATELPATGANDLWIKLAALLFLVGLGFIAAGKYTRRFYV